MHLMYGLRRVKLTLLVKYFTTACSDVHLFLINIEALLKIVYSVQTTEIKGMDGTELKFCMLE